MAKRGRPKKSESKPAPAPAPEPIPVQSVSDESIGRSEFDGPFPSPEELKSAADDQVTQVAMSDVAAVRWVGDHFMLLDLNLPTPPNGLARALLAYAKSDPAGFVRNCLMKVISWDDAGKRTLVDDGRDLDAIDHELEKELADEREREEKRMQCRDLPINLESVDQAAGTNLCGALGQKFSEAKAFARIRIADDRVVSELHVEASNRGDRFPVQSHAQLGVAEVTNTLRSLVSKTLNRYATRV